MLRKQIIQNRPHAEADPNAGTKDIATIATVLVTSELPDHPVDHVFDAHNGRGGTRWVAADDGEQTVIVAFDTPQQIREVSLEIEEPDTSRTQALILSLSRDGGRTYREVLRQEFTFSPPGTPFEREKWAVSADDVTHLLVGIRPTRGTLRAGPPSCP
jgi:hypothetical protein